MAEAYGRRAKDLTVEQLGAEVHKVLAEAIPMDEIKNRPIDRIEEVQAAALRKLGFIDLLPIKWKFHCKYVFPPGTIECVLDCDIIFGAPNTGVTMKTEDIKHGLEQLDQLARGDYHQPLSDIVASGSPEEVFSRVSRLVGVTVKQPFAEPHDLGCKSELTGSYREWELVLNRFDDPAVRGTWQYQTLEVLLRERPDGPRIESVSELGQFLQYETGFFGCLARAAQRYICNDPNLRKKIDESVTKAKASGFDIKHLSPDILVGAGGQALGSLLVTYIPCLAVVGTPVIAGFVLLLYAVGADAFCQFMQDQYAAKEK